MFIRSKAAVLLSLGVLSLGAAHSAVIAEVSPTNIHSPIVGGTAASVAPRAVHRVKLSPKPDAAPLPATAEVASVDWAAALPPAPADNRLHAKSTGSHKNLVPAAPVPLPADHTVADKSPANAATTTQDAVQAVIAALPQLPGPRAGLSQEHRDFSKQTARPAPARTEVVAISFSKARAVKTASAAQQSAIDVSVANTDDLPTLAMPQPAVDVTPPQTTSLAQIRAQAEALKLARLEAAQLEATKQQHTKSAGPAPVVVEGRAVAQSKSDAQNQTVRHAETAAVAGNPGAANQAPAHRVVTVSPRILETPAARMVPSVTFAPIQPLPQHKPVSVAERKSPVTEPSTMTAGGAKATTAPGPSAKQVTDVNWSVDPTLAESSAKPRTTVTFSATECPFLTMSVPSATELAATELSTVRLQNIAHDAARMFPQSQVSRSTTLAAGSLRHSTGGIPADVFRELKQLVPGESIAKAAASETYLSDLHQLLNGESPWVRVNDTTMVDLAPHEPEPQPQVLAPAYMEELNTLVARSDLPGRPSSIPAPPLYETSAAQPGQDRAYDEDPAKPADSESSKSNFTVPRQADAAGAPGSRSVHGLFSPISQVSVNGISTQAPDIPAAKLPEDKAIAFAELTYPHFYNTTPNFAPRRLSRNTFPFQHNPLYFEDPNLERCGQSNGCLTTLGSAAHFYATIAVTPYLTTVDHPRDCVRALPDCPTCHEFASDAYLPEWSWKAAAVQAGAVTGLFYIIP